MSLFQRGVSYYTIATCEISFPEDRVSCSFCPMLGLELKSDRHYCRKTGEYLVAVKDVIGFHCPLKFNKEDE